MLPLACLAAVVASAAPAPATPVRLKELGRFGGWRENALVGYGIVTGLPGTGDSARSGVTRQALQSALSRLGATVAPDQIQSRNVAAVIVTATLPPTVTQGDRIDVTVASIGDARSLAGGTLLMTPLLGPDQRPYALAQGSVAVGGYRFDADQNVRQKNLPTAGIVSGGATVEANVEAEIGGGAGPITFVLRSPDYTTASKVAAGVNAAFGLPIARMRSAGVVEITLARSGLDANVAMARIENVAVEPDHEARIVLNERSGTVVVGGGVTIAPVTIAQGDLKVSVSVDRDAAFPQIYGGYVPGARGLVITNTRLDVAEDRDAVLSSPGTTVGDLIQGLSRAKVKTREMIAILQAMKAAGALNAEIVVQ
ncbi:MAG: flagellar basal body P-ring protein FlgI [Proteobacteria bacterium]|nr:flagellar basal body P-ring protein FlgI [Pseudomonadota bacterium]